MTQIYVYYRTINKKQYLFTNLGYYEIMVTISPKSKATITKDKDGNLVCSYDSFKASIKTRLNDKNGGQTLYIF